MQTTKLTLLNKMGFGIGNLSYGLISQTITNFFMFFSTTILGLSGTLVGVAIALSTLWDGVTDPIVGYVSDKYTILHMGHRRGYMLIATFGMALINIMVWCIPLGMSVVCKFLWILLSLLLIETFNTFFSTPYMALACDLTDNYDERTSIQVYKTIFFLISMVIPSILMYIFLPSTPSYPIGQLNPSGYKAMAVTISIIALVCGLVCVISTRFSKQNISSNVQNQKISFKQMWRSFLSTLKNHNLKYIIFGYSISTLSAVFLTSIGMHFFTYCFYYTTKQITIILLFLLLGTLTSQPLWLKLSKVHDKKPVLLVSILVSLIGVISIMFVFVFRFKLNDKALYLILFSIFVSGFGSGALYTIPNSIYSDMVTILNSKTKHSKTATYTGMLTFSGKMFSSISLFVIGILLDIIKFNPNNVIQSLGVQTGLGLVLFVGIILCLVIGYFCFFKITINKENVVNKNIQV